MKCVSAQSGSGSLIVSSLETFRHIRSLAARQDVALHSRHSLLTLVELQAAGASDKERNRSFAFSSTDVALI